MSVADRWRLPRTEPCDPPVGRRLNLVYWVDASTGRTLGSTAEWPASKNRCQSIDGYASASIPTGSSDPTAIGLPRSLTLPSLDPELMLSSTTKACSCSSPDGGLIDGSMKASYTGLFSKNSSESGSNAFQWVHLSHDSYDKKLESGSVRTAGVEWYDFEKRGRPIFFKFDVERKRRQDSFRRC